MSTKIHNRFPTPKPSYPLNTFEEHLFKNLAVILSENLEVADLGRRASKESLQVVLTFLLNRGVPGQALHPLNRVVKAFEDLEAGIQPELFDLDEHGVGNRKWTRSSDGKEVRRYTASVMGALMAAGQSKGEAATKVARHAQTWPRFSKGVIKASTVTNWRDEFLQDPQSHEHKLYTHLLNTFQCKPEYLKEILAKGPPLNFGSRSSAKT